MLMMGSESKRTPAVLLAAASCLVLLGTAPSALAQDGEDSSQSNESESPSSQSGSEQGGDQGGSGEENQQEIDRPDPDDPDYWAKVRKVRTVQKREFDKVNRFSVTGYAGIIPNNIFEKYYPVGLRIDYFVLENIAIEVAGSYTIESKTSLRGVLNEPSGINADSTLVADSQRWHANVGILWSPSYGKAAFYEEGIGYFDLFLHGGVGMVITKTPDQVNQPIEQQSTARKVEGVLGASLAYYPNDFLAIRADFRQFLFRKVASRGGVANPSEISLGASYFFELF